MIQIDPRRLSGSTGAAKSGQRRAQSDSSVYTPPRRAEVNYIPGPESLATLISSAVEALRRGVRWDRGTILNILV